jgi:hypothetical protein
MFQSSSYVHKGGEKKNETTWHTIWLFNIAMERSTIFKFGKPSISMGHLYHGYVKLPEGNINFMIYLRI